MESKIVEKLRQLNDDLNKKYSLLDSFSNLNKREILENFGVFKNLEPMDRKDLSKLLENGGVYAVDGSTNRYGGAFPHYIQIFRGLAMNDIKNTKESVEIYCPLLEDGDIYEEKKTVDRLLAKVELDAAIESITSKPKIIFLDGSLIRYRILCMEKWEELKRKALENDILLVGVIEDIKTDLVYENIKEDYNTDFFYDREFLFNSMEYGCGFIPQEKVTGKDIYGIRSAFLRSSLDPTVIAVDMIMEQFYNIEYILSLILSITAKRGRGIPYILDLVDLKARISSKKMKYLCESYITRDRFELLFHSQRDKRSL